MVFMLVLIIAVYILIVLFFKISFLLFDCELYLSGR